MKLMVYLRSVPDAIEELPVSGGQLERDDVALKLNEFDDHALEQAVLMKEEHDCEVVAVALASAGDKLLMTALARGADKAVQIQPELPEDTTSRRIVPIVAEAAEHLGADVILTGVQTPEDMTGQLVPYLAASTGRAQANGVINASVDQGELVVEQELGGGRSAVLQLALPAVIGIQTAEQPPRYISGSRLRQIMQTSEIETFTANAELAVDSTRITEIFEPESSGSVEMLSEEPDEAAEQILSILREKSLVDS